MKKELVFEIGGEGGSIAIFREKRKGENIYIYDHHETDFTDEGMDIAIQNEYPTFIHAFNKITSRYSWHVLHLLTVHNDYKSIITDELLKKINALSEYKKHDFGEYGKYQFEKILGVKFQFDKQEISLDQYDITVNPISDSLTFSPAVFKELNIIGTVEIQYNSLIIKNDQNLVAYVLPSDKFMVKLLPRTEIKSFWKIVE